LGLPRSALLDLEGQLFLLHFFPWGFREYSDACILPLTCISFLLFPSYLSYASPVLLWFYLASSLFSRLCFLFPLLSVLFSRLFVSSPLLVSSSLITWFPLVWFLSIRSVTARILWPHASCRELYLLLLLSPSLVFRLIVLFFAPLSLTYVFGFLPVYFIVHLICLAARSLASAAIRCWRETPPPLEAVMEERGIVLVLLPPSEHFTIWHSTSLFGT
jgi:hypothetical protein